MTEPAGGRGSGGLSTSALCGSCGQWKSPAAPRQSTDRNLEFSVLSSLRYRLEFSFDFVSLPSAAGICKQSWCPLSSRQQRRTGTLVSNSVIGQRRSQYSLSCHCSGVAGLRGGQMSFGQQVGMKALALLSSNPACIPRGFRGTLVYVRLHVNQARIPWPNSPPCTSQTPSLPS